MAYFTTELRVSMKSGLEDRNNLVTDDDGHSWFVPSQ